MEFTSIGSKELVNSAMMLYSFYLVHQSTKGLWRPLSLGLTTLWIASIKAYQQPSSVCATVLLGYLGSLAAAQHSWALLKAICAAASRVSTNAYSCVHQHLGNRKSARNARRIVNSKPQLDSILADGATKAMIDFIAESSPTVESLVQQYNREEVYSTLKYPGIYQHGSRLVYKPGNAS